MNIKLQEQDIYYGNLILVNQENPLHFNNIADLTPISFLQSNILVKQSVVNALNSVLQKINAQNDIAPVSGYRSMAEQTQIFEDSLKENGAEFTQKVVAKPGCSEHQTGLAIDLGQNIPPIDFIRPDFPYYGICNKFRTTVPNYGFVERYGTGKENITKIAHEPWHFRYVGTPHLQIIYSKKLSLEEYILFLKDFNNNNKLVYTANQTKFEIYYVPYCEQINIDCNEDLIYQISGNNIDGFIITNWK